MGTSSSHHQHPHQHPQQQNSSNQNHQKSKNVPSFNAIPDNYKSIEQVQDALRQAGLESSNRKKK